jgi:hypothetical protein
MSYAAGENNALVILRTGSYFDGDNSASLANDSPAGAYGRLDRGTAEGYAFLKPGPCRRALSTLTQITTTWTTTIELWVPYRDSSAFETLAAVRDDVLAAFDKYPTLDGMGGVSRSFIEEGGLVTVEAAPGGGARYLRQDLALVWDEAYTPTLAE